MSLQDILKTERIIRISPHYDLSKALSKLSTSHDAAFLFDEKKHYMGVINPYYCLIKSSYPGNAKVEHCVYYAPHVKISYPVTKTADLFIQSKVHYLPVFDVDDKFLGIVSARSLLAKFLTLPIFKVKIKEILKMKKKPVTVIDENEPIGSAINIFKSTKYSKLIVVGRDQRLRGILSYYDLISYLIAPKVSPGRGERDGNKTNLYQHKVKNFSKTMVLTLSSENYLTDVVKLILDKRIGSVVIVDQNKRPVGILTTKDLLKYFISREHGKSIEIISKNLSKTSRQIFGGFFSNFNAWMKKLPDISKVRLFVKEEKGKDIFTVALSLFPKKGKPKVIKKEGRNLFKILSGLIQKMTRRNEKRDK